MMLTNAKPDFSYAVISKNLKDICSENSVFCSAIERLSSV